ncbi:MAG: deoxyribonuclease IV [Bacilli bacterium]|jgi:deoxyribonuclease-4|nr:deoxyribonuclease IV [Bacilli bacterium]MDD2681783.1 deoxyribonuclease IV [Bacilli bacterium]MDD3121603.1 deoxyribonuclease IV [Bacilli bacterium]MDD4062962.1 deoxyribonuclease IV [Bacilli bacterium]MDD4482320.1 deoxyribonuclease IV [Bacilli bacterium]
MKIGCHVSNKGDLMLKGSILEALSYDANCFMVYLGAPQNSYRKDIDKMNIDEFHKLLKLNNIAKSDVIIHAPYIVNLANSDSIKHQFAIDFITEEIKRTGKIGAEYIVLHPGNHLDLSIEDGLKQIKHALIKILDNTKEFDVKIALETMSGKGSELCSRFEHLNYLISEIKSNRLVVCFDTCHVHDAGYDIVNNYEKVLNEFDKIVGLNKIKVFHINDSKNIMGANKDRHENIGFGEIGFDTLAKFCYDERFFDIPKILETPFVKFEDKSFAPYKHEINMIKNNTFDIDLKNKIVII